MPGDLLTTTEVAKLLGVDRSTVSRYVRLGKLQAVRLPSGHARIRRDDVERVLRDGVEAQKAERPARQRAQPATAAKPATSTASITTDELKPLAAAVIPRDDRLLMTLRRYGKHGESWSWPSGRPEPGESLEAALVRELAEELQLDGAVVRAWVGDIDLPSGYRMSHYMVEVPVNAEPELIDHEELVEARWMTLAEVEQAISSLPAYIRDQALDYARRALSDASALTDPR